MDTSPFLLLSCPNHGLAALEQTRHGRQAHDYVRKLNVHGRWAVHSKSAPFLVWTTRRMAEAEQCAIQCQTQRGSPVELLRLNNPHWIEGKDYVHFGPSHAAALGGYVNIPSRRTLPEQQAIQRWALLAELTALARLNLDRGLGEAGVREVLSTHIRNQLGPGHTLYSMLQWTTGQQAQAMRERLESGDVSMPGGCESQQVATVLALGVVVLQSFAPMAMKAAPPLP